MENNQLDRQRGIVLYEQIAQLLRKHFRDSNLGTGSRIPTELDLSNSFGVSRGTVRQALSMLEREGLIQRVPGKGTFLCAPIEDILQTPTQKRIGLVAPYARDQLSLNILIGMETVAKKRGYQVIYDHTNESLEVEKQDVARMRASNVVGIVLFPLSNVEKDETIDKMCEDKFPFVLVDRYLPELDCSYVVSDNLGGAFRATEHLIILGHKQIAFVYQSFADMRTTSVRDRYAGYRKALSEYNIEFREEWVSVVGDQFSPTGMERLENYIEYLQKPDRPTAIVAINDNCAISMLAAAFRIGIKVPEELAIVGFDNVGMTTQVQVPLTTINVHRTDIGTMAAQVLIDQIEERSTEPAHVVLPTELIIRESCGARLRIRGGGSLNNP